MVPFLFHAVLPEKKRCSAGVDVIRDYEVEWCHDDLIHRVLLNSGMLGM